MLGAMSDDPTPTAPHPSPGVVADLAPEGELRASINLGNPVLAQGTPDEPAGVTVDLSRELARRLGVPLRLVCFDAARKSLEALTTGAADVGYLAVDPGRATDVAFSRPYAVIEGVYAVADDSPITAVDQVDREGVRVGVKEGSAYDLHLSRTLTAATIVRGSDGTDVFVAKALDVAAGIRQPVTEFARVHGGVRVLPGRFMQIEQAVGVSVRRDADAVAWVAAVVDELKASGFVADALERSGHPGLAAD